MTTFRTYHYGTLRVIRAFTPSFISRGSGVIASVVSIVGLAPVPLLAGYSASKAALQSLIQTLRGTLAKSGITVIGIYPGPIDTDLAKGTLLEKATREHVAANIVRGLEQGQTYIFPDPMALQIEQLRPSVGSCEAGRRLNCSTGGLQRHQAFVLAFPAPRYKLSSTKE